MTDLTIHRVRSQGLSNYHTGFSYKEITSKVRRSVAMCDSDKCGGINNRPQVKEVPRSKNFCPDCNAALFWESKVVGSVI